MPELKINRITTLLNTITTMATRQMTMTALSRVK